MSDAEVTEFAREPNLKDILQVRIWDDQGKVPGMPTPSFDDFAPLLQRVADAHARA